MSVSASEAYENNQAFNRITRYLHSFRHRILIDYAANLAAEIGDRPLRVLEIGCGTGNGFAALNDELAIEYTGVDRVRDYVRTARSRHADAENATFVRANAADPRLYSPNSADLVFALETLEHIPDGDVVRIVEAICQKVRPRLFIASVPVEIGPALWLKAIGSKVMGYRRTPYTFAQLWDAGRYRLNRLPPHGTSHIGFNWFWLEQTIRHNAPIRETRSLPYRWIPKPLTPTVMFVAEPSRSMEVDARALQDLDRSQKPLRPRGI